MITSQLLPTRGGGRGAGSREVDGWLALGISTWVRDSLCMTMSCYQSVHLTALIDPGRPQRRRRSVPALSSRRKHCTVRFFTVDEKRVGGGGVSNLVRKRNPKKPQPVTVAGILGAGNTPSPSCVYRSIDEHHTAVICRDLRGRD